MTLCRLKSHHKKISIYSLRCAKNTLINIKIERALITGGEPLMNIEFLKELCEKLTKKLKINFIEIETNGTLLNENLCDSKFPATYTQFNISPKLNPSYYKSSKIKSIDDIIQLFEKKHTVLMNLTTDFPTLISANYKFVYSREIEKDLDNFIERVCSDIPIIIMPLTPDYSKYTSEFEFLQDYRKSCYDAIDYCLRGNYIFSPRLHIWVFNNFSHRNEFEDVIEK